MAPADSSLGTVFQQSISDISTRFDVCEVVPVLAVVEETSESSSDVSNCEMSLSLAKNLAEDGTEILSRLATFLAQKVEKNERKAATASGVEVGFEHMLPAATGRLTPFHGLSSPPIALDAYLERISKFGKCSPACFIMALAYLDRLEAADPGMLIVGLNVHRLVITGVVLATKLTDDHYFNNAFYAKVGGVSTKELNQMEMEMFKRLSFKAYVGPDQILSYLKQLRAPLKKGLPEVHAGSRHGKKRLSEGAEDMAPPQKQDSRRHSLDAVGVVGQV